MSLFRKRRNINIIPLGQNCMPRTILTRWKVKPLKIQGEPSYPFDMAVFGMKEVTKTLRTDFSEFFNDLEYNGKFWIKAPNCIEFSHDKRFGKNDKDKLINQYLNRIENFQKAMKSATPVLFVQMPGDSEDIMSQYAQILRIRGGRPFAIAIIDTHDVVHNISLENVYVLKLPFPADDYASNWWKREYYTSVKGKIFEQRIAMFCNSIIDEM